MSEHEAVSSGKGRRSRGEATSENAPPPPSTGGHQEAVGGAPIQPAGEADEGQTSAGFEGSAGAIEAVEGFVNRPMSESNLFEEVEVTGALAQLPDAAGLEFAQPETVCGSDDRVRVSPATQTPWRWLCKLIITMANGAQAGGTGWFIGPRTVMTAGHCVFSHGAGGGWVRRIEVVPGMDASSRPYGSQVGTSFRSVTPWTVDANQDYDYGAIILPNNNLGNAVGWFGFASPADSALQNLTINNSGYPGDKPFGTQWFNAGPITSIGPRKLYYFVDTFGGQSGSPVWRFANGQRQAVGIHGYGGCPNSAARITQPVFDNMLAWKNLGF